MSKSHTGFATTTFSYNSQKKVTNESEKLLKELLLNNIRFCHWKGNSHLLESLEGKTDIEILIHPEDRLAYESIVKKLTFKKLICQPWTSPHTDIEDWIGFDYETGNLLHLHTHYAIATGNSYGWHLRLPWVEEYFRHLQVEEKTGWPIPKPEIEAIVLLIRVGASILNLSNYDNAVPKSKQNEIITLLNQINIEYFLSLCKDLKLTVPEDIHKRINKILFENDLVEMSSLAKYFYHKAPVIDSKKDTFSLLKLYYNKYSLKTIKYYHRFFGPVQLKKTIPTGGKIIALIGSDGSGKSTLCKDLVEWLRFKIDTHYFYLGRRPFIKSHNKTYNKKDLLKTDQLLDKTILSKILKKFTRNPYYVLLIKQKVEMLKLARRLSKKGSVIICDRFPQKNVIGFNDGPKLIKKKSKWYSKLEMHLFDQISEMEIDLVLRLKVSPEIAFERKPEHDFNIIKQKCDNIDKIIFSNAITIDLDANKPYNQVLLNAKREIWKIL